MAERRPHPGVARYGRGAEPTGSRAQVSPSARRPRPGHRAALLAVVLALVALTSTPAATIAAPDPGTQTTSVSGAGTVPLVVVMDLSGSMNDDDGTGTVKLAGAKNALTTVVRGQPANVPLGLWTYPGGTSNAGGCRPGGWASHGLSPVADPATIAAQIDVLTADGDTPTGPALLAAADAIRAQGYDRATIVLVSDGESNCGTPPCEVAEQLTSDGFDVTVQAMGFQVSQAGADEMACIASATGGAYVDVDDTEQLEKILADQAVPSLALEVTAPSDVLVGQLTTISATVRNPSSQDVFDANVSLAFTANSTLFPAVVPPRYRLGNIPAGGQVTREWKVTSGVDLSGGDTSFRVTSWASGLGAVSTTGDIEVHSTDELGEAAGPWLKALTEKGTVVVLGDSFSSGEGAGTYVDGTNADPNRCHRSELTHTYPQFPQGRRHIIACSGAVISHLYTSQYADRQTVAENAPQLTQLRELDPVPDLAVLSIGGNDINFRQIIEDCLHPGDCTTGDRPKLVSADLAALNPEIDGGPGRLTLAYQRVYDALNTAKKVDDRGGRYAPVIVMAYPYSLPVNETGCDGFNRNERIFAQGIITRLNNALADAVESADAGGRHIYFAAPVSGSMLPNHTACDKDPYVNSIDVPTGLTEQTLGNGQTINHRMHANAKGSQAMTVNIVVWPYTLERQLTTDRKRLAKLKQQADTDEPSFAVELDGQSSQRITVRRGQAGEVTISDLPPGATVTITIRTSPIVVAHAVAGADGLARTVVVVPPDLKPGVHTLAAGYLDESGSLHEVTRPISVRPSTPWWVWLLAAVAVASALAAAWLVIAGRRSRAAEATEMA